MNRKNEIILNAISEAASVYRTAVETVIDDFSRKKAKVLTESKKYKDEQNFTREALATPVSEANKRIFSASREFANTIRNKTADLRSEYLTHLREPLNSDFLSQIRLFNDLRIVPSRMETQALIELNKNNSGGLRALASVLETVNAPFRVDYRKPEEFEKDISVLEGLADGLEKMPAIPISMWAEGREILKAGSIDLNFAWNRFESSMKRLQEMRGSWVTDASYAIADRVSEEEDKQRRNQAEYYRSLGVDESEIDEPTEPESSVKVEDKSNGLKFAEKLGQQKAKAVETYKNAINAYSK